MTVPAAPTAFHSRPPLKKIGVLGWLHANLFSGIGNSILTLLIVALLVWALPPFIEWAFVHAVWHGTTRDACGEGTGSSVPSVSIWQRICASSTAIW